MRKSKVSVDRAHPMQFTFCQARQKVTATAANRGPRTLQRPLQSRTRFAFSSSLATSLQFCPTSFRLYKKNWAPPRGQISAPTKTFPCINVYTAVRNTNYIVSMPPRHLPHNADILSNQTRYQKSQVRPSECLPVSSHRSRSAIGTMLLCLSAPCASHCATMACWMSTAGHADAQQMHETQRIHMSQQPQCVRVVSGLRLRSGLLLQSNFGSLLLQLLRLCFSAVAIQPCTEDRATFGTTALLFLSRRR